MSWEQISGILRHILTFGGGWLVAQGWLDTETMMQVVGAIITIGGVVWSFLRKTPASVVGQAAHMVSISPTSQEKVGITDPISPTPKT